ncbi:hypothetical protein ACFY3U_21890 [Micromonospora sp. NPDC000089]|uniref:hypothetical protein n=1 Tax=unclassified Micromonospora TaxID=2617518 RepID=UPI003676253E
MTETGQPGAATPGEHGDGTSRQDGQARSRSGWAPPAAGWSGGPDQRETDPWRDPEPAAGWAAASPRHGDLPAPLPEPADEDRAPRNGWARRNGFAHPEEQARSTPVSGPPGEPGRYPPEVRRDAGGDRLVVPAQRPAPAAEQQAGPDPSAGRVSPWAEGMFPASGPPAVQVPPVGTAPSGFEVPPGFHAPQGDRPFRAAGDYPLRAPDGDDPSDVFPRGRGDRVEAPSERASAVAGAPSWADRPGEPADRGSAARTDAPSWADRFDAEQPPGSGTPAEGAAAVGGGVPSRDEASADSDADRRGAEGGAGPTADEPDWSGPNWNRPSWGGGWATPWSGEERPTGRRARADRGTEWAAEPNRPYEPLRAEPGRPYEPVRAEPARPYEPVRSARSRPYELTRPEPVVPEPATRPLPPTPDGPADDPIADRWAAPSGPAAPSRPAADRRSRLDRSAPDPADRSGAADPLDAGRPERGDRPGHQQPDGDRPARTRQSGWDDSGDQRASVDRSGDQWASVERSGDQRANVDRSGDQRAGIERSRFDRPGSGGPVGLAGGDRAGFVPPPAQRPDELPPPSPPAWAGRPTSAAPTGAASPAGPPTGAASTGTPPTGTASPSAPPTGAGPTSGPPATGSAADPLADLDAASNDARAAGPADHGTTDRVVASTEHRTVDPVVGATAHRSTDRPLVAAERPTTDRPPASADHRTSDRAAGSAGDRTTTASGPRDVDRPFRLRSVSDESAGDRPSTGTGAGVGTGAGTGPRRLDRSPAAPAPRTAPTYTGRRSAPEPDPQPPTGTAGDDAGAGTGAAVLPQRVPAEPDVPVVPEPPAVEPPAETPELARIATHLRRDDEPAPLRERPEGFDVNAILDAVREVAGVRDAALRRTPAGAHSLRLDLSDGADPAEVSRMVARLLQERMGLAAAPQNLPGAPVAPPPPPRRRVAETTPTAPTAPTSGPGLLAPADPPPVAGDEDPVDPALRAGSTPPARRSQAEPAARAVVTGEPRPDGRWPAEPADPADGAAPAAGPRYAGSARGDEPIETVAGVPRRRRQAPVHRGRASVEDAVLTSAPPTGSPVTAGTSYSGGQMTTTETAPSRPLDTGGVPGPRVVIDHVQVSTFGLDANVEVRLIADEETSAGHATGPAVDGYVLRLCAVAAAAAVDRLLRGPDRAVDKGRCFVEHAAVVPFGNCEVATVVVLLVCDGWVEQLAGSALVAGDPRQAVVRATLAAVNRRLEALLA